MPNLLKEFADFSDELYNLRMAIIALKIQMIGERYDKSL